jgi:hypothetical protein
MNSGMVGGLSGGNRNNTIVDTSLIPTILRIGVTGHRKLDSLAMVENRVREVLAMLDYLLATEASSSPYQFVVISSLAESSDRIVAREVLA